MKETPMKNSIRVSRRKMRALCAEGIEIEVSISPGYWVILKLIPPV
jgi:hypothetical protein